MSTTAAKTCATYRLFDADGTLLYVGCSAEPEKRVLDHRRQSWGAEISRATFSTHETREAAAREEYEAMLNEHPRHNRRRQLDRRTDRSWHAHIRQGPPAAYRIADLPSRRPARRLRSEPPGSPPFVASHRSGSQRSDRGEVDVAEATVRSWTEHFEPQVEAAS